MFIFDRFNTYTSQPWGIFRYELSGCFNPDKSSSTNWSGKTGGVGTFGSYNSTYGDRIDTGYWTASASGLWWDDGFVGGGLSGRYLTRTRAGVLYGDIIGVHEEQGNTWQATGLGSWSGVPLAFVSEMNYLDEFQSLSMLWGGVNSLWTGQNIPVSGIGQFTGEPGLWYGSLDSFNYKNDTHTTYDTNPGAYRGFYSLIGNSGNEVDGSISSFYLDNNGRLGYLYGAVNGATLPDIAVLAVNGAVNRYDMGAAPAGLTPENLWNAYGETGWRNFWVEELLPTTIGYTQYQVNAAWISGDPAPNLGIWQASFDGIGFPQNASWVPPQSWYSMANQSTGLWYEAIDTHWYSYNVTWNSEKGTLAGNIAGAGVDWANAKTAVLGADIKGLFDPNAATFKAISNGASMETSAFVNLVNSLDMEQKNAFMAALKIPAISVGSVDLTGSRTAAGDALNVTMTGVNFYAYSTDQPPRVFATDKVEGSYDVSRLGGVVPQPLNLTGKNGVNFTGVTATFAPYVWDTATSKWGARITGQGAMTAPSTPISFTGGAAGALVPNETTPTTGTFGGTAAGIVK